VVRGIFHTSAANIYKFCHYFYLLFIYLFIYYYKYRVGCDSVSCVCVCVLVVTCQTECHLVSMSTPQQVPWWRHAPWRHFRRLWEVPSVSSQWVLSSLSRWPVVLCIQGVTKKLDHFLKAPVSIGVERRTFSTLSGVRVVFWMYRTYIFFALVQWKHNCAWNNNRHSSCSPTYQISLRQC